MEQLISDFMSNACYVHPKPNIPRFKAFLHCIGVATQQVDDGDYSYMATSSGSASEFYIEPILSCINDYDVMRHRNDQLAIPAGHQVPRCLPAEFHHRVTVYELIERDFPCYVLVKQVGELIKLNNEENRSYSPTEGGGYVYTTQLKDVTREHGPAIINLNRSLSLSNYIINDQDASRMSVDAVHCIRCLVWPPQAAEWATRLRKYDWPDMTTVDFIVNNGCDIVQVAHPQCRQDELMRYYQWRLSFSRAETVLLNTWSVKQQLVYHILRTFMKTFRSKYNLDDSVHNYHIKTTMLWACELELDSPMTWNSCNIISICKHLLFRLAKSVTLFECVLYFDRRVNLLDKLEKAESIQHFGSCLLSLTNESFDSLFINSYIRQCTMQYLKSISKLFPDDLNPQQLSDVFSATITWRQNCCTQISYKKFCRASFDMQRVIFIFLTPDKSHLYKYVTEQLNVVDSRLLTLFFGACLLKMASILDRGHSSVQLADTILTLIQLGGLSSSLNDTTLLGHLEIGKYKRISIASSSGMRDFTVCKYYETACSIMQAARLSFNTAKSLSIGPLLSEISKFYLHSALKCNGAECRDFHARSHCLLSVYLACLYCSSERGEVAFAQSSSAISISHKLSGAFCHIERRFLPCFDERVETILGLIVFYRMLAGCRHQKIQVDVFTVDLLAFYLNILCSDVDCPHVSCGPTSKVFEKYQTYLMNKKELTIADVLLFHEMCRRTNFVISAHNTQLCSISWHACLRRSRRIQLVNFETARLSHLLVDTAVENLTAFRLSMSRDFSSIVQIATSDFQAMYAYKCGLYEKCYSLCENNVVCVLQDSVMSVMRLKNSDLLHLLDDESLSVIGLAKLCGVFDINPQDTENITLLTSTAYLLVQCELRLKHPPALFTAALIIVIRACFRHENKMIINRALLMLAYRRAIQHLLFGQRL
jgi:Mab-21 protein